MILLPRSKKEIQTLKLLLIIYLFFFLVHHQSNLKTVKKSQLSLMFLSIIVILGKPRMKRTTNWINAIIYNNNSIRLNVKELSEVKTQPPLLSFNTRKGD